MAEPSPARPPEWQVPIPARVRWFALGFVINPVATWVPWVTGLTDGYAFMVAGWVVSIVAALVVLVRRDLWARGSWFASGLLAGTFAALGAGVVVALVLLAQGKVG